MRNTKNRVAYVGWGVGGTGVGGTGVLGVGFLFIDGEKSSFTDAPANLRAC
jgi:hypothetical protein